MAEVEARIASLKWVCDRVAMFINFVSTRLEEMSKKYGSRRKPYWSLDVEGELTEGKMAITYWNEMLLTKDLLLAWLIDSEEAKPIIWHVLAHEFGHYLHHVRHVKGGSFTRERLAKEFAEQDSGMTEEECREKLKGLLERGGEFPKKLEKLLKIDLARARVGRSLGLCHG